MRTVPATRGAIEFTKKSQSGKTLSVAVGGNYFSTKNWEFENMVGQVIEFVPDASEFQGKTIMWINDWSQPGVGSQTAAQAMDQAMANQGHAMPPANPPPTQPAQHPSTYLPMTSNVVAHAIAAGVITKPEQLEAWAAAAFSAAKNRLEPTAQGSSPDGFDDDIPF